MAKRGAVHHVELWVEDLAVSEASWGWLLAQLGYQLAARWEVGQTWRTAGPDDGYIVLEAGPDLVPGAQDRRRPGVNHLAFHSGTREQVDAIVASAAAHGWTLMFADRHPYAGGAQHYAGYLENAAGFEVELVATD